MISWTETLLLSSSDVFWGAMSTTSWVPPSSILREIKQTSLRLIYSKLCNSLPKNVDGQIALIAIGVNCPFNSAQALSRCRLQKLLHVLIAVKSQYRKINLNYFHPKMSLNSPAKCQEFSTSPIKTLYTPKLQSQRELCQTWLTAVSAYALK